MDKNTHSNKIGYGESGLPKHIEDLFNAVKEHIDAEVKPLPGEGEEKRKNRVKGRTAQYLAAGGMEKQSTTEKVNGLNPAIVSEVQAIRAKCFALYDHLKKAA